MMTKRLIMTVFTIVLVAGAAWAQDVPEAPAKDCCPVVQACDAAVASDTSGGASMGLLIFVFVLAIFLGCELISKVPSQLHTPLMSGSNAISGISVVGALLALAVKNTNETMMIVLGTLAVALAMINVVGGYLVTDRMLGMFQKKKESK
jgi:NAD(P) transhydrogenase subunit alpha